MSIKVFTAGEVLAAADVNTFLVNNSSRNLLINASFQVNQRGYVSGANLASGAYGFDRWKSNFTNTTLTFTAAPQGQELTINSGGGIQQVIERANVPAGTYTLSWSGTATGRVYNSGGSASYAASPVTVTLDGSQNVVVELTATAGTKTCSNIQLESGAAQTVFRTNANSLQGELAACRRYLQAFSSIDDPFGYYARGAAASTTQANILLNFDVTMRVSPTSLEFSSNMGLNDNVVGTILLSNLVIDRPTRNTVNLVATVASGLTQFRPYSLLANNNTGTFIRLSAEL